MIRSVFKELDDYFEETKVFENETCHFYRSSFTDSANRYAREYGFDDLFCFLAVMKENEMDRNYVLIKNNDVVYDTKGFEAICTHIDMMAVDEGKKREESSLVTETKGRDNESDTNGS